MLKYDSMIRIKKCHTQTAKYDWRDGVECGWGGERGKGRRGAEACGHIRYK